MQQCFEKLQDLNVPSKIAVYTAAFTTVALVIRNRDALYATGKCCVLSVCRGVQWGCTKWLNVADTCAHGVASGVSALFGCKDHDETCAPFVVDVDKEDNEFGGQDA
jgi:hypothetical protein